MRGRFLVRRHRHALAHDLMLQIDGRFVCWRMTQGPSPSPREERSAELLESCEAPEEWTEDAEAILWDGGAFETDQDPVEGLSRGKLLLQLFGFKLRGTFSLARGKGRSQGRGRPWIPSSTWLLLKKPDAWADPRGNYSPRSVLSGLAPDEDPAEVRTVLQAEVEDCPKADAELVLHAIERSRPPFSDPGWFFELDPKGTPTLLRGPHPLFPEVTAAIAHWPVTTTLAGQFVVFDQEGRPDPKALLARETEVTTDLEHPASFIAHDLLALDEHDLTQLPLRRRKELLRRLVPPDGPILFADHIPGRGEAMAAEVQRRSGFGVVARRAGASYPDEEAAHLILGPAADAAPPPPAKTGLEDTKVRLSNLDKVFWPAAGYTKGDLLRYYRQAAPYLLPHLVDRPLVLTRYPDGIHGKSFFQHNAPGAKSKWLRTVRIQMSRRPRDYFLADDVESLLYLINLGTIELHMWPSRMVDVDRPDWCVIDLDAGDRGFREVVRTARAIHDLCRQIELPSFPKTSGGSGIHILLPLSGSLSFEQSRALGELIARTIADQHPELCTVELQIARRQGRVYLDHLVNARGRMLIAPYVVRARPGATVSTPLAWSEVDETLSIDAFDLRSVLVRLEAGGDPWAELSTHTPDLPRSLELLTELVR